MTAGTGAALSWFCVLPDDDSAGAVARRLVTSEVRTRTVEHASGRPWLVTCGWELRLRTAEAGQLRLALIGFCPVSAVRLHELTGKAAADDDLDAMAAMPGSYVLAVSQPEKASTFCDVAGVNRLYVTRIGGVPVVSSSLRLLARLRGAPVDELWVAQRLLAPHMPGSVLWSRSPYAAVRPVAPGSKAVITGTKMTVARYWAPPPVMLSLRQGADRLRDALTDAVAARAAAPPRASVQLSGGLDSQVLAALTARSRPSADTLLVTVGSAAPDNADAYWARRAAASLSGVEHLLIGPAGYPVMFEDVIASRFVLDEPAPFAASAARLRCTLGRLAVRGTDAHLNGMGGDEVFNAPLSFLAAAFRDRPLLAWRQLRGHAALHDTSIWRLYRSAAAGSYRRWLEQAGAHLTSAAGPATDLSGWRRHPACRLGLLPMSWTASAGPSPQPRDRLNQLPPISALMAH